MWFFHRWISGLEGNDLWEEPVFVVVERGAAAVVAAVLLPPWRSCCCCLLPHVFVQCIISSKTIQIHNFLKYHQAPKIVWKTVVSVKIQIPKTTLLTTF